MPIAALYVEPKGSYYGLPGVDLWDRDRDARRYPGPWPVVAHPPCARWGRYWAGSPLVIRRTGQRKQKGDDEGCFEAALNAVRRWGGVLEHPWQSHAWPTFNLNTPPRSGHWITADFYGGWTCCVEQGRYGHYTRKPTLLLAYYTDLPELDWGLTPVQRDPSLIAEVGFERARRRGNLAARGGGVDSPIRIATPPMFRDLLLAIAKTAKPPRDLPAYRHAHPVNCAERSPPLRCGPMGDRGEQSDGAPGRPVERRQDADAGLKEKDR